MFKKMYLTFLLIPNLFSMELTKLETNDEKFPFSGLPQEIQLKIIEFETSWNMQPTKHTFTGTVYFPEDLIKSFKEYEKNYDRAVRLNNKSIIGHTKNAYYNYMLKVLSKPKKKHNEIFNKWIFDQLQHPLLVTDDFVLLIKLLIGLNKLDIKDDDAPHDTLLMKAILWHRNQVARLLIINGANINEKNDAGKPALWFAIEYQNTDILKLLGEEGAEINVSDSNGFTPLLKAISHHEAKQVELLIQLGADINTSCPKRENETPLIFACKNAIDRDYKEVALSVEILLKNGANVNAQDVNGWTALMWACYYRYINTIQLLLQYGGDVKIKSHDGITALKLVKGKWGSKQIRKLLKEKIEAENKSCEVM